MAKIGVLDKQLAHILRQHRTLNLDGVTQSDIAKRAKYDNVQMRSLQVTTIDRIRKEAERRKLKAWELSLMSSLSYWKVYHTMAGHSRKKEVVQQLAKALGVEIEEAA